MGHLFAWLGGPWTAVLMALTVGQATLAHAGDFTGWDESAARHLLSRVCFGGTPGDAQRLARRTLPCAVAELLDAAQKSPAPPRPAWVRGVWINTNRYYADLSPEEYLAIVRETLTRSTAERNALKVWWLHHFIHTDAPLGEVMTLFWHGHFTTASSKLGSLGPQALYQQNQTWRKHALGNFRQFLEAVTLDPAMMVYLDLEDSTKEHPNENYARELLELFGLGVGHYTEKDIREIARALTGWTLDAPPGSVVVARPSDPSKPRSMLRDGLVPRFRPEQHDTGTKTIFNQVGRFGLGQVLDLVVAHPACSRHLASRMIAFFGAHDPDHLLRDRMAKAFVANKFEIRPMLQVLLTSPEFYDERSRGNQVKSPVRLLVGACRDLKIQGDVTPSLAQLTVPMGQEFFNPPTVKGWPTGTDWLSAGTLALRARLGETLVTGREPPLAEALGRPRLIPYARNAEGEATLRRLMQMDADNRARLHSDGLKIRFEASRIASPESAVSPEQLTDTLIARLLVVKPRNATRQAVIDACREVDQRERVALAVMLLLASPEYQLQ